MYFCEIKKSKLEKMENPYKINLIIHQIKTL